MNIQYLRIIKFYYSYFSGEKTYNGTTVWDNGTAVSLDNGTILSIDLTDKITSYGKEYSVAIRVLETTDKVTFFSKEKLLTDGKHSYGVNYGKGFAPQQSVWPNISFK